MLLTPAISYLVMQILLTATLLFASRIRMHLDYADSTSVLQILYAVFAYVRTLGNTTTMFAMLILPGALLWHLLGNCSAEMLRASNLVSNEQK